jgi:iron complex transport system substrate-binding protein
MLIEHGRAARQLKDLGLDVEVLDQRSVRGIFEAISTIGAVCGKKDQARDLNRKLEEETEAVKRWVGAKPAKRVMVVVSSFGANTNIYVSGQDGFYADLIKLAGGLSVPQGGTFGLANLSIESVMALRPDVIVEIGYGKSTTAELKQAALRRWHPFADIPAVRTGQIYVLNEDYSSIPGPRFTKLLWDFARLIHANAN